jgi:hypothetical protein
MARFAYRPTASARRRLRSAGIIVSNMQTPAVEIRFNLRSYPSGPAAI